jgi:hypothetical protein
LLDIEPNGLGSCGPLICDTEETQRLLHLSRTTLWELGRQGKLEVVHIGRRRFFTYASICAFVESLREARPDAVLQ